MARLPRLYAPGIPQLVQARFARPLATSHDPTPTAQLDLIHQWLTVEVHSRALALHGWSILPDRILLLATPAQPTDIPRVIQGLGRRIAVGVTHGRAYEARYRSALVADAWVLDCLVWLESCCVAAGLASTPGQWPWSSVGEHLGAHAASRLLTSHDTYWQLADTPYARQARYRDRLEAGLGQAAHFHIEQALFGQWALGDDAFVQEMRFRASRRVAPAARGRPRKTTIADAVTK